jgi:multidrug efflux system membrane fusion protein
MVVRLWHNHADLAALEERRGARLRWLGQKALNCMKSNLFQLMRCSTRKLSSIRPSIAGPLVVVLVCMVGGCNRGDSQPAMQMPPPLVTVSAATAADVPVYIDEIGHAVASESVTVQPQVTGMLMSKKFVDGADVKKGDLLFEIDPRPFKAALDQAKANLLQAQAAAQYAESDYKRYENLKGTPAVSEEEIEQKENTVEVNAATVKAAEAAVETAQVNLDYCRIASPIDGLTGTRLVDPGNVVDTQGPTGGTNLVVIQRLDPIYADFTIDEAQLTQVQRYMSQGTLTVNVELPQDAPSAAGPTTQPFQPRVGQLIFLDNAVQDGSGTVKLRAQLPNEDRHFWPGQFVDVRLVLTVAKSVLIPNEATQISQQGSFVYVLKPDGTADVRPIVLGQRQGDLIVVEKGLSAGEQVIRTGQTLLQPGSKVTVQKAGGWGATASAESGNS